MKKYLLLIGLIVMTCTVFMFSTAAVRAEDPLKAVCTGAGAQSAACQSKGNGDNPLLGSGGVLTNVVQILVIATGAAAVFMIMIGGFKYIISNGDPANLNSAKNTILYAIVGLAVAVLGQSIVSFVLNKV